MIGRLLEGTSWSEMGSYLSPVFFEVVPPVAMLGRIRHLVQGYSTRRGFAEAEAAAQDLWRQVRGQARGEALLGLYFLQLARCDTAVLDLRFESFEESPAALVWRPKPLFVRWEPAFLTAIRDLYAGFYGEDEARFDDALRRLGLEHGKAVLREHFGADQDRVAFQLSAFRRTFHELFLAAKRGRSRLHPDFLAFGAGLVCLYEHLERLGGVYDVSSAYRRAVSS